MIASPLPDGNTASFPFATPTPNRLVDVARLLNIPEPVGYCAAAGPPAHLRSIKDSTRERVVRFACKSWACKVCGPRLRRAAGEHYATLIVQSNGVLKFDTSLPDQWDTQKRRMNYNKVQWVRIGESDQPGVIISCDPPPKRGLIFSDRAGAVRCLGDALRSLKPVRKGKKRYRPINSSTGWKVGPKPKKFTRVGWVATSNPTAVVDKLKAMGIDPASIKTIPGSGNKLWDCVFECPPEKRDHVATLLGY